MHWLVYCDIVSRGKNTLYWSCCDLCLYFFKVACRWLYGKKVFSKPCSYQLVERNEEAPDRGGWFPPRGEQGPPCSSRGQWRAASRPGWRPRFPDFPGAAHGARKVARGYVAFYFAVCSTGTVRAGYLCCKLLDALLLLDWLWKAALTVGLHLAELLSCDARGRWISRSGAPPLSAWSLSDSS